MPGDRGLDIVVFGATGFVGRLTAEYLAQHAPQDLRIGLAGRSLARLGEVQATLGPPAAGWPLLVADSGDEDALAELANTTRVLVSCVGPYLRHGMPAVAACAKAGTHYADLTGEVVFMRATIDAFDAVASDSGARIVHSCGFDSIPSDLGVLLLAERAEADGAGELEDTTLLVRAAKGGFSGGTLASMQATIDEARRDRAARRLLADPYALSPDREREPDLGDEGDLRGVAHDDDLDQWLAPFVMSTINTRVVRRSSALAGWRYGRRFRYREAIGCGSGIQGRAKALGVALGTGGLAAGLAFGPSRAVLSRFLPAPGEGPSEEARRKGFFRIDVHTRTSTGARYVCRIAAQGDPGYQATAVMLAESARCLLDEAALPARTGVLTPATAMGPALVERLRAAGQTYTVESRPG